MGLLSSLGFSTFFFYFFATMTVVSAIGVALAPNILYSAFSLLGALGGVAGLYLLLGADFLGITQLLVYVGGILVLILFAVLLTNRIGDVNINNLSTGLMVGAPASVAVMALVLRVTLSTPWTTTEAVRWPSTARMGEAFLREYLMPFEVASIILLMALVGAMVISRRAAKETSRPGSPATTTEGGA